jgi:hypothetical protein
VAVVGKTVLKGENEQLYKWGEAIHKTIQKHRRTNNIENKHRKKNTNMKRIN